MRYYNPRESQFISQYAPVEMPFNEMMAAGQYKQGRYDIASEGLANLNTMQPTGIPGTKQHMQAMNESMALSQEAEKLASENLDLSNAVSGVMGLKKSYNALTQEGGKWSKLAEDAKVFNQTIDTAAKAGYSDDELKYLSGKFKNQYSSQAEDPRFIDSKSLFYVPPKIDAQDRGIELASKMVPRITASQVEGVTSEQAADAEIVPAETGYQVRSKTTGRIFKTLTAQEISDATYNLMSTDDDLKESLGISIGAEGFEPSEENINLKLREVANNVGNLMKVDDSNTKTLLDIGRTPNNGSGANGGLRTTLPVIPITDSYTNPSNEWVTEKNEPFIKEGDDYKDLTNKITTEKATIKALRLKADEAETESERLSLISQANNKETKLRNAEIQINKRIKEKGLDKKKAYIDNMAEKLRSGQRISPEDMSEGIIVTGAMKKAIDYINNTELDNTELEKALTAISESSTPSALGASVVKYFIEGYKKQGGIDKDVIRGLNDLNSIGDELTTVVEETYKEIPKTTSKRSYGLMTDQKSVLYPSNINLAVKAAIDEGNMYARTKSGANINNKEEYDKFVSENATEGLVKDNPYSVVAMHPDLAIDGVIPVEVKLNLENKAGGATPTAENLLVYPTSTNWSESVNSDLENMRTNADNLLYTNSGKLKADHSQQSLRQMENINKMRFDIETSKEEAEINESLMNYSLDGTTQKVIFSKTGTTIDSDTDNVKLKKAISTYPFEYSIDSKGSQYIVKYKLANGKSLTDEISSSVEGATQKVIDMGKKYAGVFNAVSRLNGPVNITEDGAIEGVTSDQEKINIENAIAYVIKEAGGRDEAIKIINKVYRNINKL